jgi:hypothetical protein
MEDIDVGAASCAYEKCDLRGLDGKLIARHLVPINISDRDLGWPHSNRPRRLGAGRFGAVASVGHQGSDQRVDLGCGVELRDEARRPIDGLRRQVRFAESPEFLG